MGRRYDRERVSGEGAVFGEMDRILGGVRYGKIVGFLIFGGKICGCDRFWGGVASGEIERGDVGEREEDFFAVILTKFFYLLAKYEIVL